MVMSAESRTWPNSTLGGIVEVRKKFFRTFSSIESDQLSEFSDIVHECHIYFPPFVAKRLFEREILPEVDIFDKDGNYDKSKVHELNALDEYKILVDGVYNGITFEFNDEGVSNPFSPYRIVYAYEHGEYTYFLKISIPPKRGVVRVIDVWRKLGTIPQYPLTSQKDTFIQGASWNIEDVLEDMITTARVQLIVGDDDSDYVDHIIKSA